MTNGGIEEPLFGDTCSSVHDGKKALRGSSSVASVSSCSSSSLLTPLNSAFTQPTPARVGGQAGRPGTVRPTLFSSPS